MKQHTFSDGSGVGGPDETRRKPGEDGAREDSGTPPALFPNSPAAGDPRRFREGGIAVRLEFSEDGPSLRDALTGVLRREKLGPQGFPAESGDGGNEVADGGKQA